MATLFSVLAWRILRTEELVGCGPWGRKELDSTERLTHRHTTWAHRFKDPPDTQPWSPGFKGQDKETLTQSLASLWAGKGPHMRDPQEHGKNQTGEI